MSIQSLVVSSKTLNDYAAETGTDKGLAEHGYTEYYGRMFTYLKDFPIKLLELGVFTGASIKMWESFFSNGHIVGVDINLAQNRFQFGDRVNLIEMDLRDKAQLDALASQNRFDIIIDDASHVMSDMENCWAKLWPSVTPGGYYIVEDLHALYWDWYNPPGSEKWLNEMLNTSVGWGKNPRDNQGDIESVTFMPGLMILRKKT